MHVIVKQVTMIQGSISAVHAAINAKLAQHQQLIVWPVQIFLSE